MTRYRAVAAACVLAVALGCVRPSTAQQQDRGLKVRPAEEERRELDLSRITTVDRTPVLPAPQGLASTGLASIDTIRLNRIVVEGRILGVQELAAITALYQGRDVTIEELFELRRKISEAYANRGFVNSGVILPDQEVLDGRVVFKEVRGRLSNIEVAGTGHLKPDYVRRRLRLAACEPLRVSELQGALELLQQDPMFEQVNARLLPTSRPGEAELDVTVKRARSFYSSIGWDNQGSASTGGNRGTVSLGYTNLTGLGDTFSADVGLSGGRWIGSATYSIPVNARDTRLQASYSLDHARIIEEPFKEIDIRSETVRGSLFVSHPWLRRSRSSLISLVGIEKKHSSSTLLGIPFSFSAGDHEGKSDTTVLNVGLEYAARTRNTVTAVRGSVRRGLDLFGSTINAQGPDSRFTAFLSQIQFARRVDMLRSELLARATAQLSADPLLAVEKIPIGGLNTVRGYRENQYVRDNGLALTLEWRIPLFHRTSPETGFNPLNLRFAPFVDYGRAWDVDDRLVTSHPASIGSAGAGLLWNPVSGLRADLYWGYPFQNVNAGGHDLQDKGIHVAVYYRLPF